jgi:tetratricopeptide (TPR) repeat protein
MIGRHAASFVAHRQPTDYKRNAVYAWLYPRLISLMGAAGLASALTYLVGVYLAFQPEWAEWAQFFVPWAVPLLLIPYVLLIGYLYLRARLGQWYLDRGRVDEAIAYSEQRLEHNLMRGRSEVLLNRLALARAQVARGDYEQAEEILARRYAIPQRGRMALEFQRWRMEAALREENLVRCREAWEAVADQVRPRGPRAYVVACRAELAAREGSRAEFDEFIADAIWIDAKNIRVKLSQALGMYRFCGPGDDLEGVLDLLEEVIEPTVRDVPLRRAELLAVQADVLATLGRLDKARHVFESATEAPADGHAEYILERVRQELDEEGQASSQSQTHT